MILPSLVFLGVFLLFCQQRPDLNPGTQGQESVVLPPGQLEIFLALVLHSRVGSGLTCQHLTRLERLARDKHSITKIRKLWTKIYYHIDTWCKHFETF